MATPVDPDEFRMSFGEHLEDLRTRLVWALLGTLAAAVVTLYYGNEIIKILLKPLNRAQLAAGLPPITTGGGVLDGFSIWMKVSLISAAIIASPWILYQIWKFVEAGLYQNERRVVYLLAPFSAIMMAAGTAFTYYFLLPITLAFLMLFSVGFGPASSDTSGPLDAITDFIGRMAAGVEEKPAEAPQKPESIVPPPVIVDGTVTLMQVPQVIEDPEKPAPGQMWVNTSQNALKIRVGDRTMVTYLAVSAMFSPLINLNDYISFALFMTLGMVIAFQLPVAMMIGGWVGIVDSDGLRKARKMVVLICVIAGAVLTPSSDPISMFAVAIPLWLLFELGLFLMRFMEKRRPPEEKDDADATPDAS